MRIKLVAVALIVSLVSSICYADSPIKKKTGREKSVNEILSKMTLRQMIGQLIMIGCDTDATPSYVNKILSDVDSNQVGGVCFFKGESSKLPSLIQKYNSVCQVPLLISIDGEWGLAMRLTDIPPLPRAMTLGALDTADYRLVYDMGAIIAHQCKTLGIHINFAPDADINLNPANPVINTRSFGQDKQKVALLCENYIRGMQDEGIMAVIKHFPGHGDTETDSHKALPTITHSKDFIDSTDLYPFRHNIEAGVWGAMVGHLNVPALNKDCDLISCINPNIVQDYLIGELGFEGLIFTDAMNMKGLTNDYPDGRASVLALKAGIDVLLMPNNTTEAVNAVLSAVEKGELSEKTIREKCKKVLRWKYDMGIINPIKDIKKQKAVSAKRKAVLTNRNTVSKKQMAELNSQIKDLNKQIAESVLTLLRNDNSILPLNSKKYNSLAVFAADNADFQAFDKAIEPFVKAKRLSLSEKSKPEEADSVFAQLDSCDIVITLVSGGVNQAKKVNYGVSDKTLSYIERVQKLNKKNILVLFGNPYALESLDTLDRYDALVVAYQNTADLHRAAAEAIFGKGVFKGSLPVSGSAKYPYVPLECKDKNAERYKKAENAGFQRMYLEKIDSIIDYGMSQKAYPGAQVLIAKDGRVVFERSVGYQTYANQEAINDSTLYDVASLTKVMATTLSVMKLYEEGAFSLEDRLSKYLPYLKKTDKSKITIKEALSHCGRLKAYLPIWKQSLEDAKKDTALYAYHKGEDTAYLQVCDSLFIKRSYKNEIRKQIIASSLGRKHQYVYSDLGFILLADLVESLSGKTLDAYLQETFYSPLGLKHTFFNPTASGQPSENIAPSIEAVDFRKSKLQGYVHDQTAALCGGVAGHAGLFSCAEDLFVLCQMLLNGGTYEGKRYLEKETIDLFTQRHYSQHHNRRSLGFDKPLIDGNSQHCSKYCSQKSYGHSGFTGTYLWIDPTNQTIFIFLSNRVYPDAKTNKLAQLNIRTDIQDLIYESLKPRK